MLDLGRVTLVCIWTFTPLATIAVGLMIWARRLTGIGLGADDYMLISAFLITVVLIAQITWAIIDEGQDNHATQVPRAQLTLLARSLFANETLWGLVNTLIRVSILLFLRRVVGTLAWVRWSIWGMVVLATLHGVTVVLEVFLICRPLAGIWDPSVTGRCGQQVVSYVILEALGLLLDLAILILPLPPIWRLPIGVKQKILISLVLSVGALVIIITGLRIQALHSVTSTDYTYSKGHLGLLSVLGALLSVITCGAPSLNVIIGKMSWKPRGPRFDLNSPRMSRSPTGTEAAHAPPSYEESQQQWISNITSQGVNEAISEAASTQAMVSRESVHAHPEIRPSDSVSYHEFGHSHVGTDSASIIAARNLYLSNLQTVLRSYDISRLRPVAAEPGSLNNRFFREFVKPHIKLQYAKPLPASS